MGMEIATAILVYCSIGVLGTCLKRVKVTQTRNAKYTKCGSQQTVGNKQTGYEINLSEVALGPIAPITIVIDLLQVLVIVMSQCFSFNRLVKTYTYLVSFKYNLHILVKVYKEL